MSGHDARCAAPGAPPWPGPPPPLVGRGAEVDVLAGVLDDSRPGTAQLVLIEGEAGIGKTRLLDRVVTGADPAALVLRACGQPLEQERPFGLVADALGDRWDTVERAAGGDANLDQRQHKVDATLEVIDRAAAAGPVLLSLDDLHWADAASVLVVDQVVRRLADQPVLVLAALRPTPRSSHLDRLIDRAAPATTRLSLDPLDDVAVGRLAAELIGASPGPALVEQLAAAAGNPFFVRELLAALADDGLLQRLDGTVELAGPAMAPSLRMTILRRLGVLDSEGIDVLRVASVLGSRFSVDDLVRLLGRPATDLVAVLDEPLRAGILVDAGNRLAFRHDLVRDTLYHDLPEAARRALHLQAGRELAAAGRPAPEVARHLAAGAEPGDHDAISWLRRAATEAMAHAPAVAADLLEPAADLAVHAPTTRDQVLVELATARMWSGQLDEARAILEELVGRPHSALVAAPARLGLIQTLIVQARPAAAIAHCDALATASEVGDRDRARGLTDATMARLMSGDVAGARGDAEEALEEGRRLGDDPATCGALAALSWIANLAGRVDDALALGQEAVHLAETSHEPETARRYPHSYLGVVLMAADRLDDGRRMFDAGRRVAEQRGDVWPLPIHHFGAVLAAYHEGRLADAEAELVTAMAVGDECGIRMLDVWARAVAAILALHRDDLAGMAEQLAAGAAIVADAGPGVGYDWLVWAEARLHEASGEPAEALAALRAAWDLAETMGLIAQRRLVGVDLVRLAARLGEERLAAEATAAMDEAAALSSIPGARAAALQCRGLTHRDAALLVDAADAHRGGPRRLDLGRSLEDAGDVLATCGSGDDAISLLTEAQEIYRSCGARRDQRRVDAALRTLGVSGGVRGRRRREATGWDALTDTELAVTRLVAEGLTNPEVGQRLFISRRTVETHLSHVFAKLGISSRVELAGEVARRSD